MVATQIVAVLMCGFGILVPKIPWVVIGLVWAYVLVWMLIMDAVKLLFFREMDRRRAPQRCPLRMSEPKRWPQLCFAVLIVSSLAARQQRQQR